VREVRDTGLLDATLNGRLGGTAPMLSDFQTKVDSTQRYQPPVEVRSFPPVRTTVRLHDLEGPNRLSAREFIQYTNPGNLSDA